MLIVGFQSEQTILYEITISVSAAYSLFKGMQKKKVF